MRCHRKAEPVGPDGVRGAGRFRFAAVGGAGVVDKTLGRLAAHGPTAPGAAEQTREEMGRGLPRRAAGGLAQSRLDLLKYFRWDEGRVGVLYHEPRPFRHGPRLVDFIAHHLLSALDHRPGVDGIF